METVQVDGVDIARYGLKLTSIEPWLSGPELSRAVTALPGYTGAIPSPFATVPARVLTFDALHRPATYSARLSLLDLLADAFGNGKKELTTSDAPDRVLYGTYQGTTVLVDSPRFVNLDATVRVSFLCADGAKYDREPRSIALGTTPVRVPLGTLGCGGIVRVRGAISGTRVVRYRGVHGNVLGEIGVDMTVSSTEFVDLDLTQRRLLRTSDVGLVTNAYQNKITGSRWFALHPDDSGLRALNAWGTLELDAGDGVFYYKRAWAN